MMIDLEDFTGEILLDAEITFELIQNIVPFP